MDTDGFFFMKTWNTEKVFDFWKKSKTMVLADSSPEYSVIENILRIQLVSRISNYGDCESWAFSVFGKNCLDITPYIKECAESAEVESKKNKLAKNFLEANEERRIQCLLELRPFVTREEVESGLAVFLHGELKEFKKRSFRNDQEFKIHFLFNFLACLPERKDALKKIKKIGVKEVQEIREVERNFREYVLMREKFDLGIKKLIQEIRVYFHEKNSESENESGWSFIFDVPPVSCCEQCRFFNVTLRQIFGKVENFTVLNFVEKERSLSKKQTSQKFSFWFHDLKRFVGIFE